MLKKCPERLNVVAVTEQNLAYVDLDVQFNLTQVTLAGEAHEAIKWLQAAEAHDISGVICSRRSRHDLKSGQYIEYTPLKISEHA